MKRFSSGVVPGHSVAIGPQPQDDGPFCLYEDHLDAVWKELEACAKLCDQFMDAWSGEFPESYAAARDCRDAILSRGKRLGRDMTDSTDWNIE